MVQEIIAKKISLLFGVSKNFDDFELKSGFEDIMPIRKVAKFRQMCTQMPKFVRQIFSKKKRFEQRTLAESAAGPLESAGKVHPADPPEVCQKSARFRGGTAAD